jgi:hypothetical protein
MATRTRSRNNPPPKNPMIAKVLEPSAGQYVVTVRMTTSFLKDYPDEPWGTSIEDIGLPPREVDKFIGYELVEIEPVAGSEDLYWIFQKLDGPIWKDTSSGTESMIPQKFRRQVTTVKTEQEVDPDTQPTTLAGDLNLSVIQAQKNTGKATRLEITETIDPGVAPLEGERFAPDGVILATEEELVTEGDPSDKGFLVSQSDVAPLGDGKAIKETSIARKRTTGGSTVDGWPQGEIKSKGQGSLTPAKFKRQVTTIQTATQVSLDALYVDDIPSPDALSGDEVQITHKKINDFRYEKIIEEELIEATDLLEGQKTDTWGINTTEEQVVVDQSPVDSGFGINASQVAPLGNGKSIKLTERYPVAESDIIYKLESQRTDSSTKIVLDIDKELVNASAAKSLAATRRSTGWYTELQPLDKWHTIMLSTKVDMSTLPASESWYETTNINHPNELQEVGVIWDIDKDFNNGTSGTNDNNYIELEEVSWSVAAEASVTGAITGRPYTKIKSGKQGAAEVHVERRYFNGPPTDIIIPYSFQPVYGQILIKGMQGTTQARGTQSGIGTNRIDNGLFYKSNYDGDLAIHNFGPFVHSNPALTILGDSGSESPEISNYTSTASTGTLPGTGYYPAVAATLNIFGDVSLQLPASSPILTSGQQYISHVEIKEWGFNVWIREVYTVTVP